MIERKETHEEIEGKEGGTDNMNRRKSRIGLRKRDGNSLLRGR